MHSIAIYFVQRLYGGPEEGEWFYDAGELCADDELLAFGTTFPDSHEAEARSMARQLDRDWNTGDHARPISSVLSPGRYETMVQDGWPPHAFPVQRPGANNRPAGSRTGFTLSPPSEAGPMKTFTILFDYPVSFRAAVTVEAEDVLGACRAAVDAAGDRTDRPDLGCDGAVFCHRHRRWRGYRSLAHCPDGREISVLAVPRLFSDIATLAG